MVGAMEGCCESKVAHRRRLMAATTKSASLIRPTASSTTRFSSSGGTWPPYLVTKACNGQHAAHERHGGTACHTWKNQACQGGVIAKGVRSQGWNVCDDVVGASTAKSDEYHVIQLSIQADGIPSSRQHSNMHAALSKKNWVWGEAHIDGGQGGLSQRPVGFAQAGSQLSQHPRQHRAQRQAERRDSHHIEGFDSRQACDLIAHALQQKLQQQSHVKVSYGRIRRQMWADWFAACTDAIGGKIQACFYVAEPDRRKRTGAQIRLW